ncbi:hypothetical protein C9374_005429 [Naegleria lovaniensis]|uniref:HP domain-containing protein n=1 Tax=Naegleria lovaniensis TaxID=51637 RepID=A0AA88GPQ4_NAELO|nr:uncharacterized protein C9374_005429 [Naegleria lovaniensis]KAG2382227.1 hypothetical protein C9374_005429 [Naegleria lovaniensis]
MMAKTNHDRSSSAPSSSSSSTTPRNFTNDTEIDDTPKSSPILVQNSMGNEHVIVQSQQQQQFQPIKSQQPSKVRERVQQLNKNASSNSHQLRTSRSINSRDISQKNTSNSTFKFSLLKTSENSKHHPVSSHPIHPTTISTQQQHQQWSPQHLVLPSPTFLNQNDSTISVLSSSNSQIPKNIQQSSSHTPNNRKNRSKSKQQLFDEVFEQLEQLDELYFDNMVSEDEQSGEESEQSSSLNHHSTQNENKISPRFSSPVIQFENMELNREFLARHERTHSLMSREEYEQKREWICKQYIEASSLFTEYDEEDDSADHLIYPLEDFNEQDLKISHHGQESPHHHQQQLSTTTTKIQTNTITSTTPFSKDGTIEETLIEHPCKTILGPNSSTTATTSSQPFMNSSLSQPSAPHLTSSHATFSTHLPKIQTSHSKVGKKLTSILNMLNDAQHYSSQANIIPSSSNTVSNNKLYLKRTSIESNEEDHDSSHPPHMFYNHHLKGNRHSMASSTMSNYTSTSTTSTAMDRTSVDASSESGNISQTSHYYLDPMIYKFSYLELKDKFPKGVKQNEKEKYLSDEEFIKVFEMDRKTFEELNISRKRRLKIEKGLF